MSYLKHETRHLADFQRFPGLAAANLEYRAKLTELAFAVTTLPRLLQDFSSQAAEERDSPHAMANWRVMRALEGEVFGETNAEETPDWVSVRPGSVHQAARRLLEDDTARLELRSEER